MIFSIEQISNSFGPVRGIIHVGAFCGSEIKEYRKEGLTNTILFEPQEHLYNIIKSKLLPAEKVYNIGLGDEETELELNISQTEGGIVNGSGASSSFLKPKVHLTEHPSVIFDGTIEKCQIKKLDDVVEQEQINMSQYNFLAIDVQGYELKVLKGAINNLKHIDFIVAEVNRNEVYEGCPMINEIDEFLKNFGFTNVYTFWQSASWGDALYVKS
jgi:FkbM family methyltransferase